MKKILLITSILIGFNTFATIDTVNVGNGGSNYSPSSLTIDLGDTVRFLWFASSHPTVSDNGMWSTFQMNSTNTSFDLILNSDGTYPYHCQFHGSSGGGGMSGTIVVLDTATVTPTSISSQPINDTVVEGATAQFIISTINEDSLQWQVDDGSGFTDIAGATSPTLSISNTTLAMDGNKYICQVFGTVNLTSDTAILKVDSLPSNPSDNITVILVQNNEYIPSTVNVEVNDTVRFKWIEGEHPTESVTGAFSTFTLDATDSIEDLTFTSEGVYKYFCQFHGSSDGSNMAGEIIVGDPVIDGIKSNVNNTFIVGPNPVNNQLNIIHNYENLEIIEIVNITGKIVKSVSWSNIQTLNVSNLEPGMYFVKAINKNLDILNTSKIIKK